MKCNSCGNEIPNGSTMCPFCGKEIESEHVENENILKERSVESQKEDTALESSEKREEASYVMDATGEQPVVNTNNVMPTVEQPVKKKKTGLIIGIVIGILIVVLAILGVIGYSMLYKSADKRINNVINKGFESINVANEKIEKSSGVLDIDGRVSVGNTSYSASASLKYGIDLPSRLINMDITLNKLNVGMDLLDEPLKVNMTLTESNVYALFSNFYDKYVYTKIDGMSEIFDTVEQNDIDYSVLVSGVKDAIKEGLTAADKTQKMRKNDNVVTIKLTKDNQKKITDAAKKSILNNDKFLSEVSKATGKDVKSLKSELENDENIESIDNESGYIEFVTNLVGNKLVELNVISDSVDIKIKDDNISFKLVQDGKTVGEGSIALTSKKNAKTKDGSAKVNMSIYVENQAYTIDAEIKVSEDVNPNVEKIDLKDAVNVENMSQEDIASIYEKVSKFGKLGIFISQYITSQADVTDSSSILTVE